jgi:hypothetical protein
MATLIFEYNVLPFLPILAPIKRIPQLERKVLFICILRSENIPILMLYLIRMANIKIES